MTPLETLATRIKHHREQKGWTQSRLSAESGVHRNRISDYENGTGNPSATTLSDLAHSLGIDVSTLFQPLRRGDA